METTANRRRVGRLACASVLLAVSACGTPGAVAPTATSAPSATSPSATGSASGGAPASSAKPSSRGSSTPTLGPSSEKPSCSKVVAGLSLEHQVGELLMVGVTSTAVTSAQSTALAKSFAGSAILLGNSTLGINGTAQVVDDVRQDASPPAGISTIVAADQEGGRVQRLMGPGFSDMPSASVQASSSNADLSRSAAAWAKELDDAGVNVNLAPVADVVPTDMIRVNAPIGQLRRSYGASPKVVANKVKAFIEGMGEAQIGTAVKHFPGLGRVRGNTDFTSHVVDSVTTRKDATLAGFAAGVEANTGMVMVSSAYYSRIDASRRAAFSPTVIKGMLRGDLGFTGVVISDDLSATAMQDLTPGERAIRFVSAGGDMIIVGDAGEARPMAAGLMARAKSDKAFAARVGESATRVAELKSRLGLSSCTR